MRKTILASLILAVLAGPIAALAQVAVPLASILTQKLTAVSLPVSGVSIGTKTDKTTWRIHWTQEPTANQSQQAQTVIDAFDVASEEAVALEAHGVDRADIMARGIIRLLIQKGVCTQAEAKAAIKAAWEAAK